MIKYCNKVHFPGGTIMLQRYNIMKELWKNWKELSDRSLLCVVLAFLVCWQTDSRRTMIYNLVSINYKKYSIAVPFIKHTPQYVSYPLI